MQIVRSTRKNIWTILAFTLGILITFMAIPGCGKPLMVGTKGAEVYHRPGCKYVEKSLEKYGEAKRLHYHDYWTVNLSGRKPCPKCNP